MLQGVTDRTKFNNLAHHITQSWQWGEFRAQTPTVKMVIRLASSKQAFQIFFHKIPRVPSLPNIPSTIAYLPRSPMPSQVELEEIEKLCRQERALFLKIEPDTEYRILNTEYRTGTPILPRHTIHIDLTLTEEKLLANMHEKARYNIRLAEKKGVKVTEGENLENFLDLLEQTEKRQSFSSHPRGYYKILWESLRQEKMVYHLLATSNQQPVASIMLLRFKDTLYYAYGGSDPKYREMMAPHLLHWEAIKLGKSLGCKIYDLWGSYKYRPEESDPWWGIYRFKSGFGGKEITFPPTVDVPLSPLYPGYLVAEYLREPAIKLRTFFKF